MKTCVPALLVLSSVCVAQAQSASAKLTPALQPYTQCAPTDGPRVVEVTRLPAENHTRTVRTLTGPKQVEMLDGVRVMFAYPNTDFFANVKAELLPPAKYADEKKDLGSEFDNILASGGDTTTRNYTLKPTINGYEATGLDRTTLDGGTLGIYMLFDNSRHVVTTVYFLNADPTRRRFANLDEYHKLRDDFLARYTACVRSSAAPVTVPATALQKTAARKKR